MQVSVVSRKEMKFVGLKVEGPFSELGERVPQAWKALVERLPAIPHQVEPGVFHGVCPERNHLGDGDGVYTYWVGAQVSAFGELSGGLVALTVPARTYATARVDGGAEAVDATYLGLARWVSEQGRLTDADAYALERFDERRQKVTPPYERFDYDVLRPLADG
ncbi:GyrI-like domain-containing protein [Myxococcaceae bacterium GXIMD 01537]